MKDSGVVVIRNQTQLDKYGEVASQNVQQFCFYRSVNDNWINMWKEKMELHILSLKGGYLRYN